MTYFVKIPAKYRRESKASKYKREDGSKAKLAPVWSFGSEAEAIEFAKSFQSCWIEVWGEGKVLFANFSVTKKFMNKAQAKRVRESNAKMNEEFVTKRKLG